MLGQSGDTWPACCHWPNTGRVDARCPIMSVLAQSYQCGTWFVCSILRELAVSNLGQPLFCLSITWSRCRNAYRDLWIMTIDVMWGSSYSRTLMPCGAVLRNVCIHIFSLFFLTSVMRSGWPAIRLRIVGIGWAGVAADLCELRLKCLATGVSLLCRISARCSLKRVRKFRFVSPTYCFLQRVHSRR